MCDTGWSWAGGWTLSSSSEPGPGKGWGAVSAVWVGVLCLLCLLCPRCDIWRGVRACRARSSGGTGESGGLVLTALPAPNAPVN